MKTNYNTLLSLVTFFTITIGGTAQNLASPLQLTDFTAECNNGPALIKWTAQVETDVDYFTLERTTDGTNYEKVATVKGKGTSAFPENYSTTDNNPLPGTSYYRLSETDMDGKTTDFNPIAFQACGAEPTMRACYERGHICIQAESESEDTYTILIVNTSGKLMIDQTSPIVKGTNSISFTPNFPDGMYIINVRSTTNSNIHFSKKLVFGDCSFKNI